MELVNVTAEMIDLEMEIINSNTFYNRISKTKDKITKKEVLIENEESKQLGAKRFFIKEEENVVGLLEYLLDNPSDQCTWLGLLLIKKEFQGFGYGSKAYALFEKLMKVKKIPLIRIGVIQENEPAHKFWNRQGFNRLKIVEKDHLEIVIYEKML